MRNTDERLSEQELLEQFAAWDVPSQTNETGKEIVTLRLYRSVLQYFKSQSKYTERIRNVLFDYVQKSQETSQLLAAHLHNAIDAVEDESVTAQVMAHQFAAEKNERETIHAVKQRMNTLTENEELYRQRRVFHNTDQVPFFIDLEDRVNLGFFEMSAEISSGTHPNRAAFSHFSKIVHKRGLYLSFFGIEVLDEGKARTHLICRVSGKIEKEKSHG